MKIRMDHVGLSVANLDRSIKFYCDGLDMRVTEVSPFEGEAYSRIMALRGAAGKVALLKREGLQLELFEFSQPEPVPQVLQRPVCDHGITHFCVEVSDIDFVCSRLRTAGGQLHCDPLRFFGAVRATYVRDLDGNIIELFENIPTVSQS
jgi:catechol 2,3-dioxygenase-like lactoylglutathione lyase family enzyme